MELFLGIITGTLFGVFLQRAEVLRFDKQVGFLCLKDMTILKFMLSAVLVGMIGINIMSMAGIIELKIKAAHIGAQLIGGGLFGIGWAILGYCPGTAVGAVGEGRTDALWGIAGMLFGAMVFARVYPLMVDTVLTWGNLGKLTVSDITGLSQKFTLVLFSVMITGILFLIRKK